MSASAAILLAAGLFAGLSAPCFADDGPKPDPSGIATGDKTAAVDAAGNPFVVAEPTDKTAPDYAANKKAFDDYQAQSAKEPLAVKARRQCGARSSGNELCLDLEYRLPCPVHAGRVSRCSPAGWFERKMPPT